MPAHPDSAVPTASWWGRGLVVVLGFDHIPADFVYPAGPVFVATLVLPTQLILGAQGSLRFQSSLRVSPYDEGLTVSHAKSYF